MTPSKLDDLEEMLECIEQMVTLYNRKLYASAEGCSEPLVELYKRFEKKHGHTPWDMFVAWRDEFGD